MPKAIRKETSSTAFQFARQFTAPPFFMGLEDAKLKSQLLLDAVNKSGTKPPMAKPAKKKAAKKRPAKVAAVKKRGPKSRRRK